MLPGVPLVIFILLAGVSCATTVRSHPNPAPLDRDALVSLVLQKMKIPFDLNSVRESTSRDIRHLFETQPEFLNYIVGAASELRRDSYERARLIRAVGTLGGDAAPTVPALVSMLAQKDPPVPASTGGSCAVTLRAIGRPAVPPLLALVKDGSLDESETALGILRGMGRAARPAVPLILDRLPGAANGRELMDLLEDVRQIDPGALRSPQARAQVPRLLAAVRVETSGSSLYMLRLLRLMGGTAEQVIPETVGVLARSLGSGPTGLGGLPALDTVRAYGHRASPLLAALADDPDPRTRQAAVLLFGSGGVARGEDVRLIATKLDDPSIYVRRAAAATLGQLKSGAKSAVPMLRRAAETPQLGIEFEAGRAVRRINGVE